MDSRKTVLRQYLTASLTAVVIAAAWAMGFTHEWIHAGMAAFTAALFAMFPFWIINNL